MRKYILSLPVLLFLLFSLSAFENNKSLSTSLKITVIDILGNVVEGATVTLYKTEDDYRNESNPVVEAQITDKKGRTTFKKVEAIKYYLLVVKGDMSNIGAGVETDVLEEGKVNKVNIIIE